MNKQPNKLMDIVVRLGKHQSDIFNISERYSKQIAEYKREDKRLPRSDLSTFNTIDYDVNLVEELHMNSVVLGSQEFTLPIGLLLVIGQTSAGKSRLVRAMADEEGIPVAYFAEALDEFEDISNLITQEKDLLNHIAQSLLSDDIHTLVIDSGRFLVFGASVGGTGKGGLDKMLFPQLSALNNMFLAAGKTLILAINPGDVTEEDYNVLVGNFESSVSTISYEYGDYVNNPPTRRSFKFAMRGPGFERSESVGQVSITLEDLIGSGHDRSAVFSDEAGELESAIGLDVAAQRDGFERGTLSSSAIASKLSDDS